MASNPTTIGKLRKQGLGDNLNTWGLSGGLNGNFDLLDDAIFGIEVMSLTGDKTLTSANYTTDNEIAPRVHRYTDGGLSAAPTITIPATENWWFINNTTAYAITYSNGSDTASISANRDGLVWTDGTTVYALDFFESGDQTFVGGLSYVFSTTTTDSDPGSGFLRLDNATQSSATGIYIDDADGTGADVSGYLATWDDSTSTVKGHIILRSKATPATFHVFSVTSLTDNTGYMDFTVSYVDGNGTIANNDPITVTFIRNGDQGDKGDKGDAGSITNAGDGSAAAPGFAFGADTDTGAYRSGDGEVSISSNGTQVGAFNSTGLDMKGKAVTNADIPVAFFFGCVM